MFDKPSARPLGLTSEPSRIYQDGELICREGETSAEMFVIRRGSVRIFKRSPLGEMHLAVLTKGDFFGEMSVLENLPRDASAQAIGETEVLVMTSGALLVRLRRDPTLAFELLRRLSGRVRTLNSRLITALEAGPGRGLPENMDTLLYRPEEKADDQARTLLHTPASSRAPAEPKAAAPKPAPRPPSGLDQPTIMNASVYDAERAAHAPVPPNARSAGAPATIDRTIMNVSVYDASPEEARRAGAPSSRPPERRTPNADATFMNVSVYDASPEEARRAGAPSSRPPARRAPNPDATIMNVSVYDASPEDVGPRAGPGAGHETSSQPREGEEP